MNFDCIRCFWNKNWGSMTRLSLFSFTSPITSDCIFISFYFSLTCDHSYCLCCCLTGFPLTWESEVLMVTWFSSKCYISFFDTYFGIFYFCQAEATVIKQCTQLLSPSADPTYVMTYLSHSFPQHRQYLCAGAWMLLNGLPDSINSTNLVRPYSFIFY